MIIDSVIKAVSVSPKDEETTHVIIEVESGEKVEIDLWSKSWPEYKDSLVPGTPIKLEGSDPTWSWGKIPQIPG